MKNRLKNKVKNKNVLRATQVVNINNAPRRREKKPLSQGNDTLFRNIHHYNTPIFHPLHNQPQPVGTRSDIDETIANLQRSVKQLQATAFPARAQIQNSTPLKSPPFFHERGDPKSLIRDFAGAGKNNSL